jgi:hypothetical protein
LRPSILFNVMRRRAHALIVGGAVTTSAVAVALLFIACVGSDEPFTSPAPPDASKTDSPNTDNDSGNNNPSDGGSDAGVDMDADAATNDGSLFDANLPCPGLDAAPGLVFTTAFEVDPGFGGLAGADNYCAQAAVDGGIPGAFKAWVSVDGTSARQRIVDPDPSRPYQLVGEGGVPSGVLVVACAAKLTSGALAHAIDRNQRAGPVDTANELVWTGTVSNGDVAAAGHCTNWTATSATSGIVGNAHAGGAAWTQSTSKDCGGNARLYCFQQ